MAKIRLYNEDCFKTFARIPDASVDMVLCDPPYGTTACSWDSLIPLPAMWEEVRRITKTNAAIVFTANQPFTTTLIASNMSMFKYCWMWVKNRPTLLHHARNRPMAKYEDVVIFSQGSMGHASKIAPEKRMRYNPQGVVDTGKQKVVKAKGFHGRHVTSGHNQVGNKYDVSTGFPHNILFFEKEESHYHPTQKPVALMEYLIRTYTDPGDLVLDFAMGSGTTGVACRKLGRSFIGCDSDTEHGYYKIARRRIKQTQRYLVGI